MILFCKEKTSSPNNMGLLVYAENVAPYVDDKVVQCDDVND